MFDAFIYIPELYSPELKAYILCIAFILGLCMGSFLNCLSWRSVRHMDIVKSHSLCPNCKHKLSARDLVPVFSWLFHKGTCRYCDAKISVRYPITELLMGVVFTSVVYLYGPTFESLQLLIFMGTLLVASLIDLETYTIPNKCIVVALLTRIAYLLSLCYISPEYSWFCFKNSLISLLVVGTALIVLALIMDKLLKRPSMGGGDIKLLAVAAFYFGWKQCILVVLIACILGIAHGLYWQSKTTTNQTNSCSSEASTSEEQTPRGSFPWGPSIAFACWIVALFGAPILNWYINLFV